MSRKLVLTSAIVLATLCSSGVRAATVEANAETGKIWTIQRFQREFCGEDTWEPFNRTMFGVFDCCMEYVADPFCYLYSSIIPKPLIKGIDNFSVNLEEPCAIFSNLFMGEWQPAWDETRRFCINSTLGIAGLFDPAEDRFCIFASNASLSDTFAKWNIPAGPPLAIPFLPRASVRGHVGYVLDFGLDIKTYINFFVPPKTWVGYSWALWPNKAPVWRGSWERLLGHVEDPYSIYMPVVSALNDFNLRQFAWRYREGHFDRSLGRLRAKQLPEGSAERREAEARAEAYLDDVRPPVHASAKRPERLLGEWREIPGFAPRSPSLDSLRALCFAPLGDDDFWWERRSVFNRDFSKSIDEREIVISNGLPKATYSFVAPPATNRETQTANRLAIVLPGIGAGRTSSEVVAMAELLNRQGFAVVLCDSLFHWEHMRSVNCGILPGYLTEDMKHFAAYLGMILDDLRAAGLANDPEISILGWSMGGLTTAYMAALDDAGSLPIRVRRFVAINPPVSAENAIRPFVPVIESSRRWSNEDARKMFTEVSSSLYGWAALDHPRYDPDDPPADSIGDPWNYAPNLTDEQASYLLALTMRNVFPTLVTERQKISPFPWLKSELTWFRRNDFYAEIGDVSMEEYIRRYVPACYGNKVTPEEMIDTTRLRRLESALARNTKLAVLHTWDDPLETDDDRLYLDRLFGNRITWFAVGAHCGHFYTKPFETELLRRLGD